MAELGPGDVVGEMGVLERAQRNATVTATSPMLLVTLTGWDVRKLRKQAPEAVDHLRAGRGGSARMADDSPLVEIKVRDNGPYKVTGPVRLIDADGGVFALPAGDSVVALPLRVLRRPSRSATATHRPAGSRAGPSGART